VELDSIAFDSVEKRLLHDCSGSTGACVPGHVGAALQVGEQLSDRLDGHGPDWAILCPYPDQVAIGRGTLAAS